MDSFVNIMPILAQVVLLVTIVVVMLSHLFITARVKYLSYGLSLIGLIFTLCLLAPRYFEPSLTLFDQQFVQDQFSVMMSVSMVVVAMVVFIYGRQFISKRDIFGGEFYTLSLISLLGGLVMASANSLLTVYLGLELLSLPIYALVAMQRGSAMGTEGAIKYFVMGALASGFLLFGMSLLYGLSGSLFIPEIARHIGQLNHLSPPWVVALMMIVLAVLFKLGAAPFHMWVPDVYQGAPMAVTTWISSISKLGAFAILIRLWVQAMPSLQLNWHELVLYLGMLSIIWGNLAALVQTNLKRLMGYSAIAQIGFVLLAIGVDSATGNGYALFYLLSYVLATIAVFGGLLLLSKAGFNCDQLEDLSGLNHKYALLAICFLLPILSLIGIPPLVGFNAKLLVLELLVKSNHLIMAVVAVVMTAVGAFYYIRLIKVIYFDAPIQTSQGYFAKDGQILLVLNAVVVLFLGLVPSLFLHYCLSTV